MRRAFFFLCLLLLSFASFAEDGYRLWLRYDKIEDAALLQQYKSKIGSIVLNGASSPTLTVAKKELLAGLQGLLGTKIAEVKTAINNSVAVCINPPACG